MPDPGQMLKGQLPADLQTNAKNPFPNLIVQNTAFKENPGNIKRRHIPSLTPPPPSHASADKRKNSPCGIIIVGKEGIDVVERGQLASLNYLL